MNKDIVILGSTGSIGTQSLEVAKMHGLNVRALTAYKNIELLVQQAKEFKPEYICIFDESLYTDLKKELFGLNINILTGMEGLCYISSLENVLVINSVVGMVGLLPTISAINAGNDVALANKETLVTGGEIVMKLAFEKNTKIIPIDSEHSAIFQCLMGNNDSEVSKIILTASGGPFYGYSKEMLKNVTKAQALKHPNWQMGAKITIDSATLMNKALELIEAVWLFNISFNQVEVVVHRQSIIHSAVEFLDGSIIAQLGTADMRTPIQFALTYPDRLPCLSKKLSLTEVGSLTFEKPDEKTFIALSLARKAIELGSNAPTILNSANEEAVSLFLQDKIPFYKISEFVAMAMNKIEVSKEINLDIILETERNTREFVRSLI
ncbi:MAG: 1-deoxy-D-xylulose-5-phosphate reductoisomerase [Clostridiales bacterium]|mgnify:FL=1|nr:1-deoxy-D-xylulose-5-phosphate reductoisomerase [Clostridiales bacterium]